MSVIYDIEKKKFSVEEFSGELLSLEDMYNRKAQLIAGLKAESNITLQKRQDSEYAELLEKHNAALASEKEEYENEINAHKERVSEGIPSVEPEKPSEKEAPTKEKGRLEKIQEALERQIIYIEKAEALKAAAEKE